MGRSGSLALAAALVVLFGGVVAYRSVERSQRELEDVAVHQQQLLYEFDALTGYGGLIHSFKNLILRPGEDVYAGRASSQAAAALSILDELERFAAVQGAELGDTRAAIQEYQAAIPVVEELRAQGLTIAEIDDRVRIDDAGAIVAMQLFRASVSDAVQAGVDSQHRNGEILVLTAGAATAAVALVGVAFSRSRLKADLAVRYSDDMEAFTRIAAHDLRGPLNQISTLVGFLRDDLLETEVGDGMAHHLDRIDERIVRLDGRVTGVFQYLRVGTSSEPMEPVDLDALVRGVAATVLPEGVELDIATSLGVTRGRTAELETVVGNIFGNAVKHHPTGCPAIGVAHRVRDGRSTLVITDDGPGIPEDRRESVFELFTTLDRLADPMSGVGLAMVRRIVNSWGGEVAIGAANPHGAVFHIGLPTA